MTTPLRELLLTDDPSARLGDLAKSNDLGDFEPALAALEMEIPKGYSHKNNWLHSLGALDRAIAREGGEPDLILRTAVLLHDIGKPDTCKFGKPGVVTFRNHETVGASMVKRILPQHGYSQEEIRTIQHLVRLHMRAYNFTETVWSESALRRLATDAGSEDNLDRLIKVFYSDLTSKRRDFVQKIEGGIARLEEAIAEVRAKDDRRALRPAIDGNELMALTGMKPGPEFGKLMKFLNSDEGVHLSREEALGELERRFGLAIG